MDARPFKVSKIFQKNTFIPHQPFKTTFFPLDAEITENCILHIVVNWFVYILFVTLENTKNSPNNIHNNALKIQVSLAVQVGLMLMWNSDPQAP